MASNTERPAGKAEPSKRTPGPWTWEIHDYSLASLVGPGGEIDHVLSVSPCKSCQAHRKREQDPLWRWGDCRCPNEGDAMLIAAAPDLLVALKAIAEWPITHPDNQDAVNMALVASQALAKAEAS